MTQLNPTAILIAFIVVFVILIYQGYTTYKLNSNVQVLLGSVDNIEQIKSLVGDVQALKTDPMKLSSVTLQSSNLVNASGVSLNCTRGKINATTNIVFIQASLQPQNENSPTSFNISNIDLSKSILLSCTDTGPSDIAPHFTTETGYLEFTSPLDPQQQTTISLTLLESV
jgi:hypothetical protein